MRHQENPLDAHRPWTRRTVLAAGVVSAIGVSGAVRPATAGPTPRAGSAADGYANPDWLVEPEWLAERLDDPAVKVVALTPADEFAAGHLPGAAQIDWPAFELTDTSDQSVARWREEVAALLPTVGIAAGTTVVVYDDGTLFAARLWWVLDALGHPDKRILNGGLNAWTAQGGAVDTGPLNPNRSSEPYAGQTSASALASLERVADSIGDPGVVLLDARTGGEYESGHIPGAINLNYPLNAEPDPPHRWKPAADLRAMYAEQGVTPDRTIIPYCSTGVRSAVSYFTLRFLGYPDVSLFTGSWAEWSAHPDLPVATGNRP